MTELRPIGLEVARKLIDFGGKSDAAKTFAEKQLEGAVALYNILANQGFAYIADEVGMGKTYVALGTIGLMRHFLGGMRVLFIVPRENMQNKWRKEIKNFAANNWLVVDQRVKTFQGTPANPPVLCHNLVEFLHAVSINANRDFLLRMTSFSMPLSENKDKWQSLRKKLVKNVPWIGKENFDLRNKDGFKDSLARAINAVIPNFDLVVIDEGHNLKHGFQRGVSARNRVLALALGHKGDDAKYYDGGGLKADRVLVLSATPVETDFRELWNQMDVLGKGHLCPELCDEVKGDIEKKEMVSKYLIRRVAGLEFNGEIHTKNMYRREWRGGGVTSHDDPLEVPGARQRLIVALIQKKVAELLQKTEKKQGKHFSRSFQIGMLASFESFLQTAKVRSVEEDSGNFDQTEQTDDPVEREGIDTPTVDKFAESYYRRFGESMPHPKMDSVASDLWRQMQKGEKSLVFVRRVASVREIQEKIEKEYDRWILEYMKGCFETNPALARQLENAANQYQEERRKNYGKYKTDTADTNMSYAKYQEETIDKKEKEESDKGGSETFFHWFFRGDGPPDILSGAAFRKNRLNSEGSILSTLFEDNYLPYVLGAETASLGIIARFLGKSVSDTVESIRSFAYQAFKNRSRQQKFPKLRVYRAYQEASLNLIYICNPDCGEGQKAKVILDELFGGRFQLDKSLTVPDNFPFPEQFLETKTFFTELVNRPSVKESLWPESSQAEERDKFREREQRREILRAAITLGHPMVDLWVLAVNKAGSMKLRAKENPEESTDTIAIDFIDQLEGQRGVEGLTSYRELERIAKRFNLIMDVNFPELRDTNLQELGRYFQATLGHQTPIGGMSGGVNNRLVKQFRMPGYPYVLVTTDVLQEGEDLHTFCARVYHYGITWTPSAMEQRTGRVDRIGSLTHRRLDGKMSITEDMFLQVYYPHLSETVELVQVREVFRRINRFLEMMHEAIPSSWRESTTLEVSSQIIRALEPVPSMKKPLRSSFEVKEEFLRGDPGWIPKWDGNLAEKNLLLFEEFMTALDKTFEIEWDEKRWRWERTGEIWLVNGDIVRKGEKTEDGRRQQIRMALCSSVRGGMLLLKCSSPIGVLHHENGENMFADILEVRRKLRRTKLVANQDTKNGNYMLSAEIHMLFDIKFTQLEEILDAVRSTTTCADEIERRVWRADTHYDLTKDPEEEEDNRA